MEENKICDYCNLFVPVLHCAMNKEDMDARNLAANPRINYMESAGRTTNAKQAEYDVTHSIIAIFENKVHDYTFTNPILASLAVLAIRRVPWAG